MEVVHFNITKLKIKYNEVLARNDKAEKYFNDNKFHSQRKEHFFPDFCNITMQLSNMRIAYELVTETEMTDKEILEGFEL